MTLALTVLVLVRWPRHGRRADAGATGPDGDVADVPAQWAAASQVDPTIARALTAMARVVEQIDSKLAVLDRRTKPLAAQAAAAQRARVEKALPAKAPVAAGGLSVAALQRLHDRT